VRSLVVLVSNAEDLSPYAARRLYAALSAAGAAAAPSLLMAAVWCIGEYGETLPAGVNMCVALCLCMWKQSQSVSQSVSQCGCVAM
jgi:hypothetical protein